MIQYDAFDFACPPRTGTSWWLRASQLAGLGPGFREHAQSLFSTRREGKLRISLVRHPCEWLQSCYASILRKEPDINRLNWFCALPRESFDEWIMAYLDEPKTSVVENFNRYKADIVLRIEDMPWAFTELMESTGIDPALLDTIKKLPPQNTSNDLPVWNTRLKNETMEKERKLMEQYDYV